MHRLPGAQLPRINCLRAAGVSGDSVCSLHPHTQFTKSNEFLPYAVLPGYLQNARTPTLFHRRDRSSPSPSPGACPAKVMNFYWTVHGRRIDASDPPFFPPIVKSLAAIPPFAGLRFYETPVSHGSRKTTSRWLTNDRTD